MSIDETVVRSTTKYKYLGSIIQSNGEIDGDVNHRIQASWLMWRAATVVLSLVEKNVSAANHLLRFFTYAAINRKKN